MRSISAALIVALLPSMAAASDDFPYIFRIDHYVSGEQSCALLQTTGAFHLEQKGGDAVRVLEGTIPQKQLAEIENVLNREPLASLDQQQVEEPLLRTRFDKLQVDIFRHGKWQELLFRSSDSQEAFKQSLQPLLRWLDHLPKSPHRELSEDEGKNNCLPRGKIELKVRGAEMRSITPRIASDRAGAPLRSVMADVPQTPGVTQLLLKFHSFERNSADARESCLLVAEDGAYAAEKRAQKAGDKVHAASSAGMLDNVKLSELRKLLENPDLVNIHHREPPGRSPVVPMLGDMIQISIRRDGGEQHIVLSSWFGRPALPSIYVGDAAPQRAAGLLQFISTHMDVPAGGKSSRERQNVCNEMGEP